MLRHIKVISKIMMISLFMVPFKLMAMDAVKLAMGAAISTVAQSERFQNLAKSLFSSATSSTVNSEFVLKAQKFLDRSKEYKETKKRRDQAYKELCDLVQAASEDEREDYEIMLKAIVVKAKKESDNGDTTQDSAKKMTAAQATASPGQSRRNPS